MSKEEGMAHTRVVAARERGERWVVHPRRLER
jgi:hypothetical protein